MKYENFVNIHNLDKIKEKYEVLENGLMDQY